MVKEITAKKILDGAKKAQPFNILKLADPLEYKRVPYSEFRGAIVGHEKQEELDKLLDIVTMMQQGAEAKYEKIYVYFILSLSEILLEV